MGARGSIRVISFAPVKGMRLVQPERVLLGEDGVAGDRRFFVCEAETMRSRAARDARLGLIEATWEPEAERLGLRFPSGRAVVDGISLGRRVTVSRRWDGAPLPAREVEGPWGGALSEELGMPLLLVRSESEVGANDVGTLTLLSEASLERLARELGVSSIGPDRFRMTLIAGGIGEHEEDCWYRRRVRAGEAVIRVLGPVPRCAVTTRDPATGERDHDVLRALNTYRGAIHSPFENEEARAPFGVYAETVTPGLVRVGDPISLID
jgi:uncharacterized protein YcbX